jgi:hypothetical protein
MRSSPVSVSLSFALPSGSKLPRAGSYRDFAQGCEVIAAGAFIRVIAPSRQRVMEHSARVIRVACKDLENTSIAAQMETTGPGGGRDGWTIIVNADIAFAPTGLGVDFPVLEEQPHGARTALA